MFTIWLSLLDNHVYTLVYLVEDQLSKGIREGDAVEEGLYAARVA